MLNIHKYSRIFLIDYLYVCSGIVGVDTPTTPITLTSVPTGQLPAGIVVGQGGVVQINSFQLNPMKI